MASCRPLPIEDVARVDELRAQVGLEGIAEATARHRIEARRYGEHAPGDRVLCGALNRREWARRVG